MTPETAPWIILILYLIPWAIAMIRDHRSHMAVGALNILLGWTIIGWVIALVWSLTGNTRKASQ